MSTPVGRRSRALVLASIALAAVAPSAAHAAVAQPTCGSTFTLTGKAAAAYAAGGSVFVGYEPATVVSSTATAVVVQTPDFAPGPRYPVDIRKATATTTFGAVRNGCFGAAGEDADEPGIRRLMSPANRVYEVGRSDKVFVLVGGPVAPTELRFDGVPATNFTASANTILGGDIENLHPIGQDGWIVTATPPAHAAGWADMSVKIGDEIYGGIGAGDDDIEFVDPPAITSLTPAQGSISGGDEVTISVGRQYVRDAAVTFGDGAGILRGEDISWNTQDGSFGQVRIRATTPVHAPGTVDVTVQGNVDGNTRTLQGRTATSDDYTFVDPTPTPTPTPNPTAPKISAIAGVAWSGLGGIITIAGSNLGPTPRVLIGTRAAAPLLATRNRLVVFAPPLPTGSYPVVLTTREGVATAPTKVTYRPLF